MKPRFLVAAAAAVIAVATALSVANPAHADATTLYVDNATGSNCSDGGSGTQAQPFCTVQAAADLAGPGQTVQIAPGAYVGSLTLTHSGTPDAPIVFSGAWSYKGSSITKLLLSSTGTAMTGLHDIRFHGLWMLGGGSTSSAMTIADSARLVLDGMEVDGGVRVTGASADISVTRSVLGAGSGIPTIAVDATASGTVMSTNYFTGTSAAPAISILGASGTTITSNSVRGPCGVTVSGTATGTSIVNNVLAAGTTCAALPAILTVGADASAGTSARYNLFSSTVQAPYSWAGTTYATVAAYQAATHQGSADLAVADLGDYWTMGQKYYITNPTAPMDSADAAAPGELDTDIYGNGREDAGWLANTGTGPGYHDRGALEKQDPLDVGVLVNNIVRTSSAWTEALTSVSVEARGSVVGFGSFGPVTFTYRWGDGSSTAVPISGPAGSEGTTQATHTYQQPGAYTVVVTADDGVTTQSRTRLITTTGTAYTPVGPTRVLDTRTGLGIGGTAYRVPAHSPISLALGGVAGLPATGVGAAVVNVTVTRPSADGYIRVMPDGASSTGTSNLNFAAGQTVANLVTTMVGANGTVLLYNGSSGEVDLVADVAGYYHASAGDSYHPLAPRRALDTRTGTGAPQQPLAPRTGLSLPITGTAGIPTTGISAVAVNLTTTNSTGSGVVTAYPDGMPLPVVSNLNYAKGRTVANLAIVPVGTDGRIRLYNGSSASTDLIADIAGYYGTAAGGRFFVPTPPLRLADTRKATGLPCSTGTAAPVVSHGAYRLDCATWDTSPVAVVVNATVTNTYAAGFLTAYPTGSTRPLSSNVNFTAGQTVPILTQTRTGQYQGIDFYNGSPGRIDLVLDEYGYFS